MTGFIERELKRIAEALHEPCSADEYRQLYAAQQALSWALEPEGFKRPYDMLRGIRSELADCSGDPDPVHL